MVATATVDGKPMVHKDGEWVAKNGQREVSQKQITYRCDECDFFHPCGASASDESVPPHGCLYPDDARKTSDWRNIGSTRLKVSPMPHSS